MRPSQVAGKNKDAIMIWGYILNSDTRALILCLQIAGLKYEYKEVDMLQQEHLGEEFKTLFPSGTIPVLVEGNHTVYGTSQIQMTHICNRYKKAFDSFQMEDN